MLVSSQIIDTRASHDMTVTCAKRICLAEKSLIKFVLYYILHVDTFQPGILGGFKYDRTPFASGYCMFPCIRRAL